MMTRRLLRTGIVVLAAGLFLATNGTDRSPLSAQGNRSAASSPVDAIRNLPWRNIGPTAQTGRLSVVVGLPGDANTWYLGAAAGGVFKTTNNGVTWKALFDGQPNLSIGAIAIAPTDPNVIYVGTGEANPRNSASFGEGVFKSIDAGEHWTPIGLSDTEKISRIVVDPRNADAAYVCALGHAWGPNDERGVFKTTDGGRNWKKILYKNDLTGCSDLDIDPTNANVVYAGMYTFRRLAWSFDSGGGETALYKSTDGGESWIRLSGPDVARGLPKGPMDRIGVAVARSNPNIVYAISETTDEGTMWRSDDAGVSWQMTSKDRNIVFRPFYYADIRIDPNHPNTVYALAGGLYKSEDGARNFVRIGSSTHGDHQGMWIDPANSNRVLSVDDGGFQVSYDAGKTFDILNNIPFTQFYNVAWDLQTPYNLCGGLQDNGSWCGPSQSPGQLGTIKAEWQNMGGGDGFFAVPDLKSPHLVYNNLQGGVISLTDRRTGASWGINPYPGGIGSAGQWMEPQKYRFNWNAPIVLAPHDPNIVYYGGNVLFRTTNYGQSWDVISPDLTTNDKSKQQSSGGPIVIDNTAAEFHCTILTIAPSSLDPQLIWVGTDDGNVQVTRDGGKTWSNTFASVPGIKANAWINKIDASRFDKGTAYVSASHWQSGDYTPYFFKTSDYGKTWTRITNGLPARGWSHVIREDPTNRDLLYAGTENGLYASWDRGATWVSIRNNMPAVPVRDITIHPRDNDVIVATHGRGIYILDDAAPLQEIGKALKTEAYLFPVRPVIRWAGAAGMFRQNERDWIAPNPAAGAYINVFFAAAPKEPLTITVTDKNGTVVRTLRNQRAVAGVNRFVWNLRADNPAEQAGPPAAAMAGISPAMLERFGFGSFGPFVLPGEYVVKVKTAAGELSSSFGVRLDPRVEVNPADLAAQHEAALKVLGMQARVNAVIDRTSDLITQLTSLDGVLAKQRPVPAVRGQVKKAIDALTAFRDTEVTRPTPAMNYRMYPRLREDLQSLGGYINRGFKAPNAGELERMKDLAVLVDQAVSKLNGMIAGDIAAINKAMNASPRVLIEPIKN